VIKPPPTEDSQAWPNNLGSRAASAEQVGTYFHIHLVSDSTGGTLNALARVVCARFTDTLLIEHIYALVRSARQLKRALEEGCRRLEVPCIVVLDPVVATMARHLAHRGVRAANMPLIPGQDIPHAPTTVLHKLIVGLLAPSDRLLQIRRNRLLALKQEGKNDYTDPDALRAEIIQARRLFERHGWPIIDETRRSVEETAAQIMNYLSSGRSQTETPQ